MFSVLSIESFPFQFPIIFTIGFLPYGPTQCLGRFLGIISRNPSVSKSNRLHVVIVRWFFSPLFINLKHVIFLKS